MKKTTPTFLGFRGNVMFPNQTSLLYYQKQSRSEYKNEIFNSVFLKVKEYINITTNVHGREYYLYYVKQFDENIMQCKLVRKTSLKKHELGKTDVTETTIDDYPYINVFVHLHSQKFLIELNQSIFADYMTSKMILESLINSMLSRDECFISIAPITDEMKFWNYIDNSSGIYEVEFLLKAPNFLDGDTDAEEFLREIEGKTQITSVGLKLTNEKAELSIKKDNIDSYVKYASAGGGEWTIKKINASGKKETIKSMQKCRKLNLSVSLQALKSGDVNIDIITAAFIKLETIKKFMEENKGGKN